MTKWIGIHKICKKYSVSPKNIYQWSSRGEITISILDDCPMVDEDTLLKYLERKKIKALYAIELKKRNEDFIRENEEQFFLIKMMIPLSPIMHVLIMELSRVISNDKRRELFLYLALNGDINQYSEKYNIDIETVKTTFKSVIREVRHNSNFLLKLRSIDITQRAEIASQRLINTIDSTTNQNDRDTVRAPENIVKLLSTHISEMGFDARSQHTLIQNKIRTLADLLLYTKEHGFSKLLNLSKYGVGSLEKLKQHLREIGILDNADKCNLYKYL